MSALRFTNKLLDALACPPGRKDALFFDQTVSGFGVRVTESGARHFLVQYRHDGKTKRLPIGRYGVLTVDQARLKARALLGAVADGRDPIAEREEEAAGTRAAEMDRQRKDAERSLTWEVLTARWAKAHLSARKLSYRNESKRILTVNFAAWMGRPAASISRTEASDMVDRIGEERGAATARLSFVTARALCEWARKKGLIAENPFADLPSPAKTRARDRVLNDEELAKIWSACDHLGWPFGPFNRFLLLTLQRRDEVADMRWDEISADGIQWIIPADRTKSDRVHHVDLSDEARRILAALPRFENSPFVFTTNGKSAVSGFSVAKMRLDRLSGVQGWRLHDYRRTGVSTLARLGVPPHVADRILNHASGTISGVAAVYQRYDFAKERSEALAIWEKHLLRSIEDSAR